MLAIKISLTVTIIAFASAILMIGADTNGGASARFRNWTAIGGFLILVALFGVVVTALLTIWLVLPA